jgi:hypothetical protein
MLSRSRLLAALVREGGSSTGTLAKLLIATVCLQPALRSAKERRTSALPSAAWPDREPAEVTSPAVPAGDDRPDQHAIMISEDHGLRIAAGQRGHRLGGIRYPAAVPGRLPPQRGKVTGVSR